MKRILVVDDEAMARRLVCKTLTREGYEVDQAANGLEAWQKLTEYTPDGVITDIDMPRMTGEELCRRISEQMPDRTFPIIVVTSKTALEHRAWARLMHNVSFIEKPLSLRKLIEKMAPMFSEKSVASGAGG